MLNIFVKHPDVVSVFKSQFRELQTTRSWEFLGLQQNGIVPENSAWKKAKFGQDLIIANLDTGMLINFMSAHGISYVKYAFG